MPDQPGNAGDYLHDVQTKIGQGLDNAVTFARKAMTEKHPARALVTGGLELVYSNTALTLEIYRSTFNFLFRSRKR